MHTIFKFPKFQKNAWPSFMLKLRFSTSWSLSTCIFFSTFFDLSTWKFSWHLQTFSRSRYSALLKSWQEITVLPISYLFEYMATMRHGKYMEIWFSKFLIQFSRKECPKTVNYAIWKKNVQFEPTSRLWPPISRKRLETSNFSLAFR